MQLPLAMTGKDQSRIRELPCRTTEKRRDEGIAGRGRKDLDSHQQNMSRRAIENSLTLQPTKF